MKMITAITILLFVAIGTGCAAEKIRRDRAETQRYLDWFENLKIPQPTMTVAEFAAQLKVGMKYEDIQTPGGMVLSRGWDYEQYGCKDGCVGVVIAGRYLGNPTVASWEEHPLKKSSKE